jgi:hypothetical protein
MNFPNLIYGLIALLIFLVVLVVVLHLLGIAL